MSRYPEKVKIVEVGPRDGLQNEKEILPTEAKIRFIELLADSGLTVIEAGSLVRPDRIPQLADTEEVYRKIKKKPGVAYPVLVPNLKGLDRALGAGVREIAVFTAASETFNKKNINRTIAESLGDIAGIAERAKEAKLWVRGYISTAFVCPYEGKITPERVLPIAEEFLAVGVDEISIGDTIGAAVPTDVEKLLGASGRLPLHKIAVHFHDTYGTALANIVQAVQMGVKIVDSSAGGLGGCPYAPGASGNVATEDVVFMLEQMGIKTGVNLAKLVEVSRTIESILKKSLPSRYLQICKKR